MILLIIYSQPAEERRIDVHLWSPLQVLKTLQDTADLLPIEQNGTQKQHIRVKIENSIQVLGQNGSNYLLMNPPFGIDETGERIGIY